MKYITTRMIAALAMCMALIPGVQASAERVHMDVSMGSPLIYADRQQIAYVRVALRGIEIADPQQRTPINLAIVLDKSGSMQGDKIRQAKKNESGRKIARFKTQ